MVNPTIGGVSLGNVESITSTKDANIIPIPFPGADSSSTETFDLLGVTRIITVSGSFTGTNVSAVKTLVEAVEILIDGDQNASISFDSDELGTGGSALNVKIASFDITWVVPSNRATYVLKLLEGT